MKILFLYIDEVHAWPLLKSAHCLSQDIIESYHVLAPESVLDYRKLRYDVLLIHQELVTAEVIEAFKNIIILEKIDGAQLAASRNWIQVVKGVFKGYSFKDKQLHNSFRGRAFAHFLNAYGCVATRSTRAYIGIPPLIQDYDLEKIKVFYGFGAYQKIERVKDVASFSVAVDKKYSLFFAGTLSYDGSEIETHRRLALERALEIPGNYTGEGKVFPYPQYIQNMRISEFVLCPFGWGEATHREYEAMLVGSHVIKPFVYGIEAWPDIYQNVHWCKPDFSDLEEVMAEAFHCDEDLIDNWKIASSAISSEVIANKFEQLVREVI